MDQIAEEIQRIIDEGETELTAWGGLKDARIAGLVQLLADEPSFSKFAGQLHHVGDTGRGFADLTDFAQLLVRICRLDGVEFTLQAIADDSLVEEYTLNHALLISETAEQSYEFCNGVKLVSIYHLPESSIRDILVDRQYGFRHVGVPVTNSALLAPLRCRRYSEPANGERAPRKHDGETTQALSILQDTQRILSLARSSRHGIANLGITTIYPKNLNFLGLGIGWSSPELLSAHNFGHELLDSELRRADNMLAEFAQCDEETRNRFSLVLKRLNASKLSLTYDHTDACVDLRICLENLFLNENERASISKTLKARVPSHTSYSRKRTEKLYSYLSEAVHRGRLSGSFNFRIDEIIEELSAVTRKFLNQGGYPKWQEIPAKFKASRLLDILRS